MTTLLDWRSRMIDEKLFEDSKGVRIDFGCGENKKKGWIGVDIRPCKGVDIIQDLNSPPFHSIPSDVCILGLLSHLYEHIEPKNRIALLNELWRIMKVGGQLMISAPYATSMGAFQDPTHYPCPNEVTFQYFDPQFGLYSIYKPKPWKLVRNDYNMNGNITVILEKQNGTSEDTEV